MLAHSGRLLACRVPPTHLPSACAEQLACVLPPAAGPTLLTQHTAASHPALSLPCRSSHGCSATMGSTHPSRWPSLLRAPHWPSQVGCLEHTPSPISPFPGLHAAAVHGTCTHAAVLPACLPPRLPPAVTPPHLPPRLPPAMTPPHLPPLLLLQMCRCARRWQAHAWACCRAAALWSTPQWRSRSA